MEKIYEGAAVLDVLLRAAGSSQDARGVRAVFERAVADGATPDEVVPSLFPEEPRFAGPEEALRLYGNLFGLLDRVARGEGEPKPGNGEAEKPRPAPPTPRPPPVAGDRISGAFVEQAWRHLADLPPRERARLRDRYEEAFSELAEFVRERAPAADVAAETADTLAFELWAMNEMAFGPRRWRSSAKGLEALWAAPPQPAQPALAAYADEAIREATLDEEAPVAEGDAAAIRRLAATVIAALAD